MLSESFWVSIKRSKLKLKLKLWKFNKYNIRQIYFGIRIVLLLWRYCNAKNTNFFRNSSFEERNNMAVGKALRVMKNFCRKKQCLPVIKWNKKHSPKQIMSITCTLEKMFFLQLLLWKVCESFLFGGSKKIVLDFGLYESLCMSLSGLYFCEILYEAKTVYKKKI